MSNHAERASPGSGKDFRKHDATLVQACRFDVAIEPTFFQHVLRNELSTLTCKAETRGHSIVSGVNEQTCVSTLVTSTCCSLTTESGEPLAALSEDMLDSGKTKPTSEQLHALALRTGAGLPLGCDGRVVVVADSGFIGTSGAQGRGKGLIGHGDNLRFVMNAIRWLGSELG